jgi:NTP pyrophosphatase (non-canonical NTP hydrolase)
LPAAPSINARTAVNKREYFLTKLVEECLEVAQRATKAMCFGLEEVQPGQGLNNLERLNDEWNDLLGTVEVLSEECNIDIHWNICKVAAKHRKLLRFAEYSRQQGCLTDEEAA